MHGCLCNTCVQCQWMPEEEVRSSTFHLYETSIIWEFRLAWIGDKINQAAGSLVRTAPRSDHVDFRVPWYRASPGRQSGRGTDGLTCLCALVFHFTTTPLLFFFSFQEMFFYFPQFLPLLFLFSFLLSCSLWPC